jgi:hypothetical protein
MPTKRRRIARGTTALTMRELSGRSKVCLAVAWDPSTTRTRWATWREYLSDYQSVRLEFLASVWGHDRATGAPCFAERVLQEYGPGGPPAETEVHV